MVGLKVPSEAGGNAAGIPEGMAGDALGEEPSEERAAPEAAAPVSGAADEDFSTGSGCSEESDFAPDAGVFAGFMDAGTKRM